MKTVLITGASSGIGLAITRQSLEKSYKVIAHYRHHSEELLRLKSEYPECLFPVRADFMQKGAIPIFWQEVEKISEGVDILVNGVAIIPDPAPIENVSEAAFDAAMTVNLKVPFLLSQKVLPHMTRKKWGRIINLSSIGVKFGGGPTTSHYSISKSALEALTRTLHRVCAPNSILVNTVRVGVTNTKLHRSLPGKNMDERISLVPLRRMAEPEEIANAVSFLMSEESSYIAGTTITVAGGE